MRKRSSGKAADPERSAAMRGNKNASGGGSKKSLSAGNYGARMGVGSAVIGGGILGGLAGGAIVGAAGGNRRASSRFTKTHTGVGTIIGAAISGGVAAATGGTFLNPAALATGAVVGGVTSNLSARGGLYAGKKLRQRK